MTKKIQNFTDLEAWKISHQLALDCYRLTRALPSSERYNLIDQIKRCSVSVPSNIAEGFSRTHSKEKIQFYTIALGSVCELESQIRFCREIEYISAGDYASILGNIVLTKKLLRGLMKYLRQ